MKQRTYLYDSINPSLWSKNRSATLLELAAALKELDLLKMSLGDLVHVIVGGFSYYLAVSDIERYPDSYFAGMTKKEWIPEDGNAFTIERDGVLFRFINAFLVNGNLPRDNQGQIAVDEDTLALLQVEADFYCLDELVKECKIVQKKGFGTDLDSFVTIRDFLSAWVYSDENDNSKIQIEYSSELIYLLKAVWAPFCSCGSIGDRTAGMTRYSNLFASSSSKELYELAEVTAAATQSPYQIDASSLSSIALHERIKHIDLSDFAPHLELEIRPCKWVMYKAGGHVHEHRYEVKGDGHIGTLVINMDCRYTGGELEVTHDGHTEKSVTGAYRWVAMYCDCLHKINPVTSGTREALICDIYGTPRSVAAEMRRAVKEVDKYFGKVEGEIAITEKFWLDQEEHGSWGRNREVRGLSEVHEESIVRSVGSELMTVESLIITLDHLYLEYQTSPAFLKGGDRALYDLLSEHYDVQVICTTLFRQTGRVWTNEYGFNNATKVNMFNSACLKNQLAAQTEVEETTNVTHSAVRTKVLISGLFDDEKLLHNTPRGESNPEDLAYILSALQVCKRAV